MAASIGAVLPAFRAGAAARSGPPVRRTITVVPPAPETVRRPPRTAAPRAPASAPQGALAPVFRSRPGSPARAPRLAWPGLAVTLIALGLAALGLRVSGMVQATGQPGLRPVQAPASPVALHPADPCPIARRLGEFGVRPLIACEAHVWRVPGGAAKALAVAHCESRFLTDAMNPTGCGGSGCSGVFQQSLRYWGARAAEYGFARVPPTDVRANVVVSMRMAAEKGTWADDWPVCAR